MRKTKTAATVIRTETREADGASYVYRLIMRESEALSSYRLPLYSVEIEFCGADGVRTEGEARDVFADPGRAIVFFDMLVKNLATPIDLPYILEDSARG